MKMKKIQKIAMAIATMMTLSVFSMFCVGCRRDSIYEEGYYIYRPYPNSGVADIIGLTDLGREQEYLVIPEYIAGIKVQGIGRIWWGDDEEIIEKYGDISYGNFTSEKLKKVYCLNGATINDMGWIGSCYIFDEAPNLEGVFSWNVLRHGGSYIYSPVKYFDEYWFDVDTNNEIGLGDRNRPANVTYYYNYENAPQNGCYWIDDYDGNTIEFIPENPIREGYVFGGWFKEPECENVWNFETDTVPKKEYLGEDNWGYLYQETALYAKWYKK